MMINKETNALRKSSSPDRSGNDGTAESFYTEKAPRPGLAAQPSKKAISHCFCEGCERSSKGYAEEEKSRVVVAPHHYSIPLVLLIFIYHLFFIILLFFNSV